MSDDAMVVVEFQSVGSQHPLLPSLIKNFPNT